MSDFLAWPDLAGRRVGIYGMGTEGRASLRACQALGIDPVLVDDRPQTQPTLVMSTSGAGLAELLSCEVVVVSPGISAYSEPVQSLRRRQVEVVGGLGLWLAGVDRTRVVCVTGTKGKSTTSALAGHFLSEWGYRCMVGGNIGSAPWDPEVGDDFDFWVVEVSSYQATMLQVGPPVVAVTSLSPDHLPWHRGSVETYYRDKLSICALPGVRVSVANGASVELRAHANLLGRTVKWVEDRDVERESWVRALPLVGRHNQRNAVLAATMLREAGIQKATDFAALHEAVGRFAPLAHRLTTIGIVNGVRFVDDSLATNVLPTIAALESFPVERVALIVGGQDRGIDYRPLGTHIRDHGSEVLVLAVPESGERIASEVSEALVGTRSLVRRCADLREAVAAGFHWARPDGVVLLSPAAPSFGAFRDYAQRSEVFAEAMSELPGDR